MKDERLFAGEVKQGFRQQQTPWTTSIAMVPTWVSDGAAHLPTSVTSPETQPKPSHYYNRSKPDVSSAPYPYPDTHTMPAQPEFGSPPSNAASHRISQQATASPSSLQQSPHASPSGKGVQNFNAQPPQLSRGASADMRQSSPAQQLVPQNSLGGRVQPHQQSGQQDSTSSNAKARQHASDAANINSPQILHQETAPAASYRGQQGSMQKASQAPTRQPSMSPAISRKGSMPSADVSGSYMQLSEKSPQMAAGNPRQARASTERSLTNAGEISFKGPSPDIPDRVQNTAPYDGAANQTASQEETVESTAGHKRQSSSLFDEVPGPMLTYPVVPLDAVDLATQETSDMLEAENSSDQHAGAQSSDQSPDKQGADADQDVLEGIFGNDQGSWAGFQSPQRQVQQGFSASQQRTAAKPMQESPVSSHPGSGVA